MKIKDIHIQPSSRSDKRAMAVITLDTGKTKKVHFGSPMAYTFYDGATSEKKENYLKRHSSNNEDWSSPLTAGFWARWVLWSFKAKSRHVIIKLVKRKSNLEIPELTINLSTNKKPQSIMDYKF